MVGWFLSLLAPLLIPNIAAKSAILMDYTTGEVLWAHNEREKLPPASLTKILSAIIILESGDLHRIVTVGENPPKIEPSVLSLGKGDKISLENLLTAMLVRSANDAAVAAAEYIGGSEQKFVKLMNQKARELGAFDSHFVNAHGLHHPLHYSTAYDLAIITRYALRNPFFASIVSSRSEEVKWWSAKEGKEKTERLENTNKLLSIYPYTVGVKTGYTLQAGRCLSAAAKRGEWQIICIILNSPDVWKDAIELFKYAFDNFRPYFVAKKNTPLEYVKVRGNPSQVALFPKEDILFVLPKDIQPSIKVSKSIYKTKPPIRIGEKLGVMSAEIDGRTKETELIAGNDVAPDIFNSLSSFSFKFSIFAFLILIMLRLWEERRKRNNIPGGKNLWNSD